MQHESRRTSRAIQPSKKRRDEHEQQRAAGGRVPVGTMCVGANAGLREQKGAKKREGSYMYYGP